MRSTAIGVLVVLLAPVLCAQQSYFPKRFFIRGLGGVTLGNAETSPSGGGGFGVRLHQRLDAFVEAGMVHNVMPRDASPYLDSLRSMDPDTGAVFLDLDVKAPLQYAFAGLRFNTPTASDRSTIKPYLEVGGGAGRLSFDYEAAVFGIDLTPFLDQDPGGGPVTKLMLTGGGGILISASPSVGFDLGYRYQRISTAGPAIGVNQIYLGLLFRF